MNPRHQTLQGEPLTFRLNFICGIVDESLSWCMVDLTDFYYLKFRPKPLRFIFKQPQIPFICIAALLNRFGHEPSVLENAIHLLKLTTNHAQYTSSLWFKNSIHWLLPANGKIIWRILNNASI